MCAAEQDPEVKQILSLVHTHEDPTDIFELLNPLGEGSYGYVYKGINKKTGQPVAIKIVPMIGADIRSSIKEMEILGKCKSPYVVKYYGAYYKTEHLWLVMEYCEAGSAVDMVNITEKPFTEVEIASILEIVLKGVCYLHKNKMIHRDIKAANILIDIGGNVKIADFGVLLELPDLRPARHHVWKPRLGHRESVLDVPRDPQEKQVQPQDRHLVSRYHCHRDGRGRAAILAHPPHARHGDDQAAPSEGSPS